MAEILPGNGLQSALQASIAAGATTLQIASGDAAIWPTGGEYRAVICQDPTAGPFELVRVTGGQGTATLTVTRAVEAYDGDQTARAWAAGAAISAVITHDSLQLAAGITLPLTQNLTFSPDNTYDIGASGANRPRTVYAGTSLVVGADVNLYRGTLAGSMDQRGGATGQSYRLYTAYTDASNYERLRFTAATTGHTIASEALGSGTVRAITFSTTGAGAAIQFTTAGSARWNISASGHLLANTDSLLDIGASAASRPRTIYAATSFIGPGAVPTGGASGQVLTKTSASDYALAWQTPSAGGGGLTLPLDQNLTFAPDGTYDVGVSGNRPRDLNMSRTINAGGHGIFAGEISALGTVYSATSVAVGDYNTTLSPSAGDLVVATTATARWKFSASGHLLAAADATYDIGASGGSRPANVYVGATVYSTRLRTDTAALELYSAGTFNIGLFTSGSERWRIDGANGYLLAGTDNLYDIGASGATRPRDLWLGRDLSVTGLVGIGAPSVGNTGIYLASSTLATSVQFGVRAAPTFTSAATSSMRVLYATLRSAGATYTTTTGAGLYVDIPVLGSGHAVTNTYGVYVANQGVAGITNAYGLYIDAQSGAATTNIGLYNLGTTRMDGNVGVGGAPVAGAGLIILSAALTGTQQWGVRSNPVFSSAGTSSGTAAEVKVSTQAAAFTMSQGNGLLVQTPVLGAGSTVTSAYGINVQNQGGAGRSFAYGLYINAQSGASTTNIGLFNGGTTQLSDTVGIFTNPDSTRGVDIQPANLTGTGQYAAYIGPTHTSAATSFGVGLRIGLSTAASAFTMAGGYGLLMSAPVLGAGSAITTMYGVNVANQGAPGVTNAYGIYINAQSGAVTNNNPLRILSAAAAAATNSPIYISGTTTGVFMRIDNTVTTTVGAAGAAAAAPTPVEYIRINVNGTNRKIACYTDAA